MDQEKLREAIKRIKWEYNVSYKVIAQELLEMNYRAFLNWLHGRSELGRDKRLIIEDYVSYFDF